MTAVSASQIPDALKVVPRWLLWRLEDRNGKPSKTPYQSNGKLARVDDPTTWTTFEKALTAYQAGGFDGVGITLTDDDDLIGIDLDKCLNPETGELEPEAARIVAELPTYCEVSPSGRGLRLFGFGKLPQGGRRKGKIEMYESGRYLTVTGHRFNGHDTLADIAAEVVAVHARIFGKPAAPPSVKSKPSPSGSLDLDDAALLEKARSAKNGGDFERLWSGDTAGNGGDHSAADLALCSMLAFWANGETDRIDRLFRQSGLMRPKWDKPHFSDGRTYGAATVERAVATLREGYSGRREPPRQAGASPRPAGTDDNQSLGIDPYRGTDEANAALFLEMHGEDVRYCPPWEKWLIWSGSRWRIDDRLDIYRLAADLPRAFYRQAADEVEPKTRQAMAALAKALESINRQSNFLFAARCRVVVHHSDLDKGRFLLNAKNGTVDLETGGIRPHRRADLLTHDTEIHYDPTAMCPTWERFLSEVFQGDSELIVFLQRAIGYSLTGSVAEQILLICFGCGSNGKSVFLNILRKLLGMLALQAAPDLLMADRNRRHPTEQADLFGKRLVVCQETAEGRRFNESLVKQLTGGDAIRARRMHEDFWEFEPTHKLWLSTNHRPEIKGTDHAIWRRVRLVPFNVQFTDDGPNRKDKGMEAKLTAELPGILAWAVRGCLDWQRHGLGMAEAVKVATEAYRADMDVLAAWLGECCILGKKYEVKASSLYASYTAWCESNGETAESQRKWGMRLAERSLRRDRRMIGFFWIGIGLLDPTHHEPNEPYEPEKAIFRANSLTKLKLPNKVHDGSYGSCNPSDTDISSHHQSVDLSDREVF